MNKETEEVVIGDIEDALKFVEDAIDCITYFDREMSDYLDTDDGHIAVRLEEVAGDMRTKIRRWERQNEKHNLS